MFNLKNDESHYDSLVVGHGDDITPFLRPHSLQNYRSILAYMISRQYSSEQIIDYMKQHESMAMIANPINLPEVEHNQQYQNYVYNETSLRSMFKELKNVKDFNYYMLLDYVYDRIMEKPVRHLNQENLLIFHTCYPEKDLKPLVQRHIAVKIESGKGNYLSSLGFFIKHSLIDNDTLKTVLDDDIMTLTYDISRSDFDKYLSNIIDPVTANIIERFKQRTTLLNRWE